MGYAYAIIGGVGPADFYTAAVRRDAHPGFGAGDLFGFVEEEDVTAGTVRSGPIIRLTHAFDLIIQLSPAPGR